uniref:Uncharacterized protein n=1 Tax=Rhizophora mucronata TaxID=61149 RepID=A0A2P2QLF2_RHIMU
MKFNVSYLTLYCIIFWELSKAVFPHLSRMTDISYFYARICG